MVLLDAYNVQCVCDEHQMLVREKLDTRSPVVYHNYEHDTRKQNRLLLISTLYREEGGIGQLRTILYTPNFPLHVRPLVPLRLTTNRGP